MAEHAAPGPASTLQWRLSPWDGHVHAFRPDMIGEVTAEALCEHSARTSKLGGDDGGSRCFACLLLHGAELADRHGGDLGKWRTENS